jgi:hypothetical protein
MLALGGLLFWTACVIAQPTSLTGIGNGLAAALGRDDASVGITALEALQDKWASGEQFWRQIVDDVFRLETSALDGFLLKNYREKTQVLNRIAVRLPPLAERLDNLFSKRVGGAEAEALNYDVLRNTRTLSDAGQQRILSMRAKSAGVDAFIVANPSRFAATRNLILAGQNSGAPLDVILAIDFAATTGDQITDPALNVALSSNDARLTQSAARYLAGRNPEFVGRFRARIAAALARAQEEDTWAALIAAQAVIEPEAGVDAIRKAGGLTNLGGLTKQIAALRASASSAALDNVIATERDAIWGHQESCELRLVGTELLARLVAADRQKAARDHTGATAAALQLTYAESDCTAASVSRELDRLAAAGAFDGPNAVNAFEQSIAGGESNPRAGEWISGAPMFCRALHSAVIALASSRSRSNTLLAAGLANCLRPSDKEYADLVAWCARTIIEPEGSVVLPVLTALIGKQLTDEQVKGLSAAMVTRGLDSQRSGALASLLASARRAEALSFADENFANGRAGDAVPVLERALLAGEEPERVITDQRSSQLLNLMTDVRYRAKAVEILARRRTSVKQDDLGIALILLALDKERPIAAADCLDFSLFGPFSSPKLGLIVLVAKNQPYSRGLGEYATCAEFLSPFDSTREIITTLVSGTPSRLVEQGSQEEKSRHLDKIMELWTFIEKLPEDKAAYMSAVVVLLESANALSPYLPYFSFAAISTLADWHERAGEKFPDRQTSFFVETWKRRGVLYASMVPSALILHISLWGLLLTAYPRYPKVQAVMFYNPVARRALALGYLDVVLLAVPKVRRLLFEPLQHGMLGRLTWEGPRGSPIEGYYGRSDVVRVELAELDRAIPKIEASTISGQEIPEAPVVRTLSGWSGRTLLIGPSGRGKTSWVRHHLQSGSARLPAVYLTAQECKGGMLEAIAGKVGALGTDQDLISSLVRGGKLDIYVDGLNEADSRTRGKILTVVADHVSANLFLATQHLGEGLPALNAYYLVPFSRLQMAEFLLGREPFLDPDAPVRGNAFREAAKAFLGSFEVPGVELHEEPNDAARFRLGFFANVANPMDLQTTANLLAQGIEPDPLNLQRQQFELVNAAYRRATGSNFPVKRFGESVLKARLEGTAEIDSKAFSAEVDSLLEHKQVYSTSSPSNADSPAVYQFRHDRISDFYMQFAFLGDDPSIRYAHVGDDRLGGVYDLLARILPPAQADELKEVLILRGMDSRDHRQSDSFIQHLRWRRLLEEMDPDWISDFDPNWATQALEEFRHAQEERKALDDKMVLLRDRIDRARVMSRILTARDSATLLDRVARALAAMGATVADSGRPYSRIVEVPEHGKVELWGVASAGQPSATVLAAMQSLIHDTRSAQLLIVVNVHSDRTPTDRDNAAMLKWLRTLPKGKSRFLFAINLYQLIREAEEEADTRKLWRGLAGGTQNTKDSSHVAQ